MDIFSVITLFGGLAFFLYGMHLLSSSLEKMVGGKLERILRSMTSNRFKALLLGMGITIAIQSSSAMTVMLVGLENSCVMEIGQTIGIIMGSNIGTTLTAWLLSLTGIESENFFVNFLKPKNFSPLLALIGILLIMGSKRQRRRDVGRVMMGFSILMYGMELMSGAVSPLADMPGFTPFMTAFTNPFLGVLVGAAFTGIIQSSAASVGIQQALALTGSITYGMAIPIIMGQNIGTCVTALLSSIGVNKNAKRVAVVHISFNIIGTILCLSVFYGVNALFPLTFIDSPIDGVGIAAVHSIFNVVTTAVLLPFPKQLEKLANMIVNEDHKNDRPTFLDELLLRTPSIAVNESRSMTVRMANLAVYATHSTNGVSALHSEILKDSVFHDFYTEWPNKFKNVTNGIAHRRWLNQSNPELASLITELTGDGFIHDAAQLEKLMKYKDDTSVQKKLAEIKLHNKQRLAEHVKRTQGQIVDPNSIFDVQVKRLHEYKRQHMNALHILSVYQWLLENPNADYTPHTFFFGAKAAPGYYFAKEILQFIVCLADTINNDPRVNQKLRVIFVENYCVSWAELLTPAAEISEQISLAGTEASGTSNMKFMINGAITLGTLDGANVEIHDAVGDDNIILFGMTTPEVNSLRASGYTPRNQYEHNDIIRKAMDARGQGFNGKTFQNLHQALLNVDQYMALADFASYSHAQQKAEQLYKDQTKWNSMSLVNTAKAGIFAADRAIRDYANTIWLAKPVETKAETKKK